MNGGNMEHVNTLKAYKDLISSGVSEKEAEAHVYLLNTAFDNVVTKKDLNILENDLKIFFSWILGATLLVAFILPILAKKLGWG